MCRSYDNLRTIAFEICEDAYMDGVRTLELRINPVIHRRAGLTSRQVLNAVRAGMKDALKNCPDLKLGITVIAIRGHGGNMAKILLREVVGELAMYHESPGVVGFDIAGAERPFPPILFKWVSVSPPMPGRTRAPGTSGPRWTTWVPSGSATV
jgi:adenosine deaminase